MSEDHLSNGVKSERLTLKKEALQHRQHQHQLSEFLFDPIAAAYYGRFSEYLPGKHSLNVLLASYNPAESKAKEEDETHTYDPIVPKSYYQEYCETYGIPAET